MPDCPNCGRSTMRTEDWACRYCGYPLLSGSYKKVDKTYRQLKQEEGDGQVAPVVEARPPAPEPAPEPEPEMAAEPEPEPEPEPESEPEDAADAEPEPAAEPEPKPRRARRVSAPKKAPAAKPAAEPASGMAEMDVEELYAAFAADKVAADEKLADTVFRATGVVDKVMVEEIHDIYYIILTGVPKRDEWNLRCTFDKEHGAQLVQLAEGQKVTVQGEYDGYRKNILMRDCILVA